MKKMLLAIVTVGLLAFTSVALAAGPTGRYRATINSTALNGALNGTWTITLTTGHYAVAFNGRTLIHGTTSVSGSEMTVSGGGSEAYCHASGLYRFHRSGKSLTFTVIKDSTKGCGGRKLVLTKGHFTKVK
jgi:hypothetical protein